jgi:hypothetical protein
MARISRDHDFATVARRVVEQAVGEHLDGTPLEQKRSVPNRSIGGRKGGRSRAIKLTPRERHEIAKVAAQARWKKN